MGSLYFLSVVVVIPGGIYINHSSIGWDCIFCKNKLTDADVGNKDSDNDLGFEKLIVEALGWSRYIAEGFYFQLVFYLFYLIQTTKIIIKTYRTFF